MARTHFMSCPLCEACCGLTVQIQGDQVTSIRGDEQDEFSRGYICPKATALADIHHDPDRLTKPIERTANGWRELPWDEALDKAAVGIRQIQERHGNNALAFYQGNPTVHSMGATLYGQLLFRRLKTRNRYSATSADQLPHMLAGLQMFGHQLTIPVPDIDRTDYMLIIGANPVVSNGSLMTAPDCKRRIKAIRERGGTVVVIDPRRTETAALADRHLFIRPGRDPLFLLAIVHTLFTEQLVKLGALADRTTGVSELRTAIRNFAPDEVAGALGISAKEIRTIARELAGAPTSVCYGRIGICTQEFGGLSAWLVNVINLLTGNLDRAGGAMFSTPAFDLVKFATRLGQRGSYDRYRSRVRNAPEFGGELPVSVLTEEIETAGSEQIRGLITAAGNPVLSIPNGARLDKALKSLEYMLSIDIYLNETTRHANLILPPTFALERDHYDVAFGVFQVRNTARYSPAAFRRRRDQRHDWQIFAQLAARMDVPESRLTRATQWVTGELGKRIGPRTLVNWMVRTGPHKLAPRRLHRAKHGLDLGPLEPRLQEVLHTEDHNVQVAPACYLSDLERLRTSAGTWNNQATDQLELIGRRQLRSNNSWMHNSRRLVTGRGRCTLLVHPEDAATLGLRHGEPAEITTRTGTVQAPVEVTDEVMPGVVSLPHGWGHHRAGARLAVARDHAGVSANDITDDTFYDTMSGNACFSAIPVTVRPISP